MNDKVNVFMTWLTYESGVLTERFQKRHLAVNYSLLALSLVAYLLGAPVLVITLACVPGVIIFFASLEALAWRQANEGLSGIMQMIMENLPR